MKNRLPLLLVALATILPLGAVAADGEADATTTLTGEYVWSHRDNSGDLRAIFTPSGARTWDVAFHFTFRGKPHVYSGTAKGSLTDGPLEGTVKNENERRTFTFEGEVKGGAFSGTHAELEDGKPYPTGTLTLAH